MVASGSVVGVSAAFSAAPFDVPDAGLAEAPGVASFGAPEVEPSGFGVLEVELAGVGVWGEFQAVEVGLVPWTADAPGAPVAVDGGSGVGGWPMWRGVGRRMAVVVSASDWVPFSAWPVAELSAGLSAEALAASLAEPAPVSLAELSAASLAGLLAASSAASFAVSFASLAGPRPSSSGGSNVNLGMTPVASGSKGTSEFSLCSSEEPVIPVAMPSPSRCVTLTIMRPRTTPG
ncbi:hypothetical protein C1J01_19870 [Nonomuraea aridisoli]|uniref:Uncharacterized protein n=1 Tax=Nonomuraea aridisoli TaxID=2070368 RepID=A0A2W2F5B3_9ACTN|nr:hypothetical protein C1J01_19870 [Nonomuraea aridisoli]